MTETPEEAYSRLLREHMARVQMRSEMARIVRNGARVDPTDSGVIHGPPETTAPDPDWRLAAVYAGCRHEEETLKKGVVR